MLVQVFALIETPLNIVRVVVQKHLEKLTSVRSLQDLLGKAYRPT